jgi:hypothetical protein
VLLQTVVNIPLQGLEIVFRGGIIGIGWHGSVVSFPAPFSHAEFVSAACYFSRNKKSRTR